LSNVEDIDIIKKITFDFDNFSIFNHGDGFQSRVIIGLKILRLLSVVNSKGLKSAFVAIEEPEAHLHPHNQKDLLKRLKLMKKRIQQEHGIKPQFFITSHSSNILTEINPGELIIMKKKDQVIPIQQTNDLINELSQQISSTSGESLTKIRKGLLRAQENLFKFYPECFFSRVIIIGEGQTEEGAFPEFAKKLDLDLDSYGITYISILGGGKLSYYKYLLDKLQYDYFYIIDKDKGITDSDSRAFITEETAFEYEMFKTLPFAKILECISDLILEDTKLQLFPRFASEIGDPTITNFEDFVLYTKTNTISNPKILKFFKKQFTKLKGSLLGYYVGSKCTIDEIPDVYKKIIEKAAEKSKEI
jgi:predicted ATP-dependent endonuclease of OLD family